MFALLARWRFWSYDDSAISCWKKFAFI